MAGSRRGRARGAGSCPRIGGRIVSPAGIQISSIVTSAPDDHFGAGPHSGVIGASGRRVRAAGGCPGVLSATNSSVGYYGKDKNTSRRYNAIVGLACLFYLL